MVPLRREVSGIDLRHHDELDRQQDLPGHRPRCRHVWHTVDPADPAKLVVTTSRPAPYTRRVTVYVPQAYVPGTAAPFIVGADGPDPLLFTALDHLIPQKRVPVTDRHLDRQRQRRRAGQPARPRIRHDVGPLRGVRRGGSAAARRARMPRDADEGSRRARDHGRQLRWIGGVDHGLVPPGAVSPRADLLRHLREPAMAAERRNAARRVGVPRAPHPEQPAEADSHLDGGRRPRPAQSQRHARRHARLGRGEPAHGPRARGQRLSLSVRICAQRRPHRSGGKQQTLPAALEWLWRGYR